MLGPLQVLERVLTEIDDLRAPGQVGREQCARRLGDEHLAAVGSASDPRPADDVEPEVALFPEGGFAGMQTHSNLDLGFSRPALGAEPQLSCEGATHAVTCPRKREEQGVALSVDFGSSGIGRRLTNDTAMLRNELPVTIAELLKQPGRALDVAEEEGDGADRETCHRQHCLQQREEGR